VIKITDDGKIAIDAQGYEGNQCLSEIENVLEGLALPPMVVEKKSDYYTAKTNKATLNLRGGRKL
jgi:hypothetical protein